MSVKILALESSCDETAAAIIEDGNKILSNIISSQIEIHKAFGGVVPEIASRRHLEIVNEVIEQALQDADVEWDELSAVAVTYGPGLVGSLLVGVSAAKALAYSLNIPLIALNHIESHIYANFLVHLDISFPLVCLVVSGGHTDLVYFSDYGHFNIIGRSRDDAAGEAYDKVARTIGLDYPGGPAIDKLAAEGDPFAYKLPRAYLEEGSLDFSFSGLKSAVLNLLNQARMKGETINAADLAASFQNAVVEVLADKLMTAQQQYGVNNVLLAGGVSANQGLRNEMEKRLRGTDICLYYPPPLLCTDNAAMVGCAAYYHYLEKDFAPLSLNAVPHLHFGEKKY